MLFHSELPLSEGIEVADPISALRAISHLPYPFLLHSTMPDARARWSFFGADPFAMFAGGKDYEGAVAMWQQLSEQSLRSDPAPTLVPFTGGVVGYWSYDFGRRLERIPELATDDLGLPEALLGFYDVVGAYDHHTRQAWLFSSGLPLDDGMRAERAQQRLDQFSRLFEGANRGTLRLPARRDEVLHPTSTFRREQYLRAIEQVQEHIRAGSIYQANLSQRWRLDVPRADPSTLGLALHDALSLLSPSPYSAYLGAGSHTVVSASPERFLELRSGRIETRPIKGTRPRSSDEQADRRLRDELLASAKDRAENVMIVDVLRNDLGRVSELGTVKVASLCELEAFPQVFHLTSTINGDLREDLDPFDLLHACFPGGSVTGAPKIRAMEILESLEPVRRHLYTGAIGYVDWRGDADWNIAIRTAVLTPGAVHFAAGGGITAESDPATEYEETLHKAEGLRLALERIVGPIELAGTGGSAEPAARALADAR